jgi:predicted transcriptional regulator
MSKAAKASAAHVHVGGPHALGKRLAGAWHGAARSASSDQANVKLLDLETLLVTLSPRRLELLRHVRLHGAANVRELATAIGRDYKNVHHDVAVLESAGLLLREGRGLSAPWDTLQASILLA